MSVISAIGGYNFGCFNSLAIEHNELSSVSVDISHKRDKRRSAQSEKKNSSDWRKKRISNKLAKSSKITKDIKKEGETYGAVMSLLGKGKKADLIKLAIELGECESKGEELKIIELRTKIITNDAYKEDPEFVKCIFEGIVSNRIDEENKQKEQTLLEFELQKIRLQKIRLQNETQRVVGPQTLPQTKIELKKLLPTFNPEVDNMDLFLALF
ncbi:uncharacterized protein TNCV_2489131 [Trichonephila clavipes]|nr:uncharacterized protein TNCV_2489131 [Trichonephila clavipes]